MFLVLNREYVEVDRPYFKPGFETPVVVDNVWCTGNEEDYQMCPSSDWGYYSQCKNPALLRCSKL
ncbi:hypothetical protein DPMN_035989 [Dreissena polymorpha]|uniref:Uncharacterized protein n=1 Tax=Dreissena polymorpha TaxID=45954 RepID=A0A9D4MAR1_DREPO|nr:hypothetical protein DPMN_035989 [Dreissena polymorpha]